MAKALSAKLSRQFLIKLSDNRVMNLHVVIYDPLWLRLEKKPTINQWKNHYDVCDVLVFQRISVIVPDQSYCEHRIKTLMFKLTTGAERSRETVFTWTLIRAYTCSLSRSTAIIAAYSYNKYMYVQEIRNYYHYDKCYRSKSFLSLRQKQKQIYNIYV